jgi:cytochrome bd-type quinol oxidase subunit 2
MSNVASMVSFGSGAFLRFGGCGMDRCYCAAMDLTDVLAILFATLTAAVVAFQLALAAGAPWGAYAMGGAFPGRMPAPMRVGAVVQAALLAAIALVVLSAAELVAPELVAKWPWLAWVPVVVSAVAMVLNASTRSQGERRLWLPVTIVLFLCSMGVALGIG